MANDECFACETASGRVAVPGGLIWETSRWTVDHCVGPLGVGTLIVKPKRHVVHVSDLDDEEAAELGPVLRNVAAVVTSLTAPEQVYNTLWSHMGGEPGHIHYVVHPVTRALMDRYGHGSRLQPQMFDAKEFPDEVAVVDFAQRARDEMKMRASSQGTQ